MAVFNKKYSYLVFTKSKIIEIFLHFHSLLKIVKNICFYV